MKTILTGYILYSPDDAEVTLQSVQIPGRQAPRSGLTLLFGHSAAHYLSLAAHKARVNRKLLQTLRLEVDTGEPPILKDPQTGHEKKILRATPALLPKLKTLSLQKVRADVKIEDLVANRFRKYIQEEGAALPRVMLPNFGLVALRPDLIDRLRQESEFSHLGLIIFPVLDENNDLGHFATLFDPLMITKIKVSALEAVPKIRLPFDKD